MRTSSIGKATTIAWFAGTVGLLMPAVEAADPKPPPCLCRYAGERFDQGRCVCIMTPAGPRRACCGKVLNNASWIFKNGACPVAMDGRNRARRVQTSTR